MKEVKYEYYDPDIKRRDPLIYNDGDAELEPYLQPLLIAAGGSVAKLHDEALRSALDKGLLEVYIYIYIYYVYFV